MMYLHELSSSTTVGSLVPGNSNIVQTWIIWNQDFGTSTMTPITAAATTTSNAYLTSTTGDTWTEWNQIYTATTSNHIYTSYTASTTSNIITATWSAWNDNYLVKAHNILVPPRISEEERQRRAEAEKQRQLLYAEEERKRKLADAKAEKLLLQLLDEKQAQEYKEKGRFHMYVGNKKYRIDKGWAGNVKLVEEKGNVLSSYCIHPRQRMPEADNLIAQKLMLEANEQEFLRVANETRYRN